MEIVGIDPGLVHTGVVLLRFTPSAKTIEVDHSVIDGPDADATAVWLTTHLVYDTMGRLFCEEYRPRSHLNSDKRMVQAEQQFKSRLPRLELINNTGMKKVVKRAFMERLGLWSWTTKTHHQDLRSAAMVLLYGMFKDEGLNRLLADFILDHINGNDWKVSHL
jgi:hypothetical protein